MADGGLPADLERVFVDLLDGEDVLNRQTYSDEGRIVVGVQLAARDGIEAGPDRELEVLLADQLSTEARQAVVVVERCQFDRAGVTVLAEYLIAQDWLDAGEGERYSSRGRVSLTSDLKQAGIRDCPLQYPVTHVFESEADRIREVMSSSNVEILHMEGPAEGALVAAYDSLAEPDNQVPEDRRTLTFHTDPPS